MLILELRSGSDLRTWPDMTGLIDRRLTEPEGVLVLSGRLPSLLVLASTIHPHTRPNLSFSPSLVTMSHLRRVGGRFVTHDAHSTCE